MPETGVLGGLPQPVKAVLLGVNSQYIHSSLAPWCLLAGLNAYARAKFDAAVLEGTVNEPSEALLSRIIESRPQLLGISCTIWNITCVAGLLPLIREALPGCVIVLGGPEVSYRAQDALASYPQADYLIAGEGELPFARLLDALCGLGRLDEVPGLCLRSSGGFIIGEPHVHQAMQPSPYGPAYVSALGGRIAYLETSRGCPYRCAFCLSGRGEKLRCAPLERAYGEILLLANSGTRTVKLVDRTFNADRGRALAILRFIADHAGGDIPRGVTFHFEVAGDLLDDPTLSLIESAPAGLFRFEIGLQSMDEATLHRVRRGTDMALLARQVGRLISCGRAHVHLDLIAGLPGEGLAQFARGFNAAYALRPHALQLGFLKLIHGSAMRGEQETYPCSFDPLPPYQVRATPWLSGEDLALLAPAEYALDKLHNSGRFAGMLSYLTTRAGMLPFDVFMLLGRAIHQAEAAQGRLSLEGLITCVFDCLSACLPQPTLLRDLMIRDRLASTPTAVLPGCLKRRDPRHPAVKRALERRFPRPAGVTRAIAILYTGEEDMAVFCDYVSRDPVTGLYPLTLLPVEACLRAGGESAGNPFAPVPNDMGETLRS
ncbi:MAG: DUF4080 domain-containing protein [Christensenellales bacterium]